MIRRYRPEDLEVVVVCFTRSVRTIGARDYAREEIAAWAPDPPDMSGWPARLASGGVFVAELDGALAGFVRIEATGYIDLLYVDPSRERMGIGRSLLEHAFRWAIAQGARGLEADVSRSARPLFETLGFRLESAQAAVRGGVALENFRMSRSRDGAISATREIPRDTRTMSDIAIRRMTSDEIAEVATVWRRSRLDAVPEIEERLRHTLEDDLHHLSEEVIPHYEVWIAQLDRRIVGMMSRRGEDLDKLYVDPGHQGRGIGTLLLNRAKIDSPSGLKLFTHQVNTRARSFYEARGFVAAGFGVSPPPEDEPDVTYIWKPQNTLHTESQD